MVIAQVPQISISLAPPEDSFIDPPSPYPWASSMENHDDGFRPKHLTPPPSHIHFPKQCSSPLRPSKGVGNGLEPERFEAMLKASRERNAVVGSKKAGDLRKEIALKAHKNKQVERRALFLSKVLAPPSPTATSLPKTPPDSPAIFHYTLPSPGLVSPLALFETLSDAIQLDENRKAWVEQVDFRLPSGRPKCSAATQPSNCPRLPSLDQISARLASQGYVHTQDGSGRGTRLPAFLTTRSSADTFRKPVQRPLMHLHNTAAMNPVAPKSPCYPLSPQLEVTTILVPRTTNLSPTQLSESNLHALDSRERRACNMLSTLRRRTMPSDNGVNGHADDHEDRRSRRHSAPADLTPLKPRTGFEHPILSIPGAF